MIKNIIFHFTKLQILRYFWRIKCDKLHLHSFFHLISFSFNFFSTNDVNFLILINSKEIETRSNKVKNDENLLFHIFDEISKNFH